MKRTAEQVWEQFIQDVQNWPDEDKQWAADQLRRAFRGPRRWQDQEFPAKKNQNH